MNGQHETETLVESFCALADEVQYLIDRKTILEHKLRFAAEQYQQLADKYAPTAPEISETLANLQLPPDQHIPPTPTSYVPLPRRGQVGCNQHQIALLIRDGRRAAQQLSSQTVRPAVLSNSNSPSRPSSNINTNTNLVVGGGGGGGTGSTKGALSGTGITTMSTIMELDFTVEGKKGVLDCPFTAMKREQQLQRQKQQLEQENQHLHIAGDDAANVAANDHDGADTADMVAAVAPGTPVAAAVADNSSNHNNDNVADGTDPTPHNSKDPICSAMFEESTSQRAPSSGGAARCPIRFLDQHSPEEVANYVDKHKHELPRSHAICLRRYNKNEEQIRKIDAKYGSLVNMISGLGQFHQPMMGSAEPGAAGGEEDPENTVDRAALHRASHERVKNWANGVSAIGAASGGQDPNYDGDVDADDNDDDADDTAAGPDRRGRHRSLSDSGESNTRRESSGSGDAGNNTEQDREGHFDRPFKEVRLGESPSRPWGIAVPISSLPHAETHPPLSPPAAPVRMPSPIRAPSLLGAAKSPVKATAEPVRKCPFDHSKFGMGVGPPPGHAPVDIASPGKATSTLAEQKLNDDDDDDIHGKPPSSAHPMAAAQTERPPTPAKQEQEQQYPAVFASKPQLSQTTQIPSSAGGPQAFVPPKPQQYTQYAQYPQHQPQPTFVNLPPKPTAGDHQLPTQAGLAAGPGSVPPQMVFTGPVFIGYPMEQAIQFMQHFQNMQGPGR
ncbi:hypothetical protein F503_02478 [Ophiostoma piceae UAMH 11346]|uniref:Uncharacterized protein n=1 Tax=Ophiostoma piceae (strain UAMH 11346) TaxID=1262450 RepID=S3CZG9_OPHP1|nr:hypothetical protein F503_02478 [Ophiostoma piceae UAMH 11346]